MKNSANIMETTFCNSKDIPEDYITETPVMIYRKGQYIPLHVYNKHKCKAWRPKQKILKGNT